jgi:hypothetical protein
MRSNADWSDVRYRCYTQSVKKAEQFKKIKRVQFTDSGHGIVPVVTEAKPPYQKPAHDMRNYVNAQMDLIRAEEKKR